MIIKDLIKAGKFTEIELLDWAQGDDTSPYIQDKLNEATSFKNKTLINLCWDSDWDLDDMLKAELIEESVY